MTLFERIIAGELPASEVHRDAACIAFMDIHPMGRGHVLVCPLIGVSTLKELNAPLRAHLWEVAQQIALAQQQALGSIAQHFLVNDGRGASQSVPHVHLHVIPRYRGDRWRTLGRIALHIGIIALAPPISAAARQRLDEQAAAIRAALGVLPEPPQD